MSIESVVTPRVTWRTEQDDGSPIRDVPVNALAGIELRHPDGRTLILTYLPGTPKAERIIYGTAFGAIESVMRLPGGVAPATQGYSTDWRFVGLGLLDQSERFDMRMPMEQWRSARPPKSSYWSNAGRSLQASSIRCGTSSTA
jgi:hypothetical protein